ncbi:MAG: hypothetical protein AAFN78_06875 [Pseudomonadota bacterium]
MARRITITAGSLAKRIVAAVLPGLCVVPLAHGQVSSDKTEATAPETMMAREDPALTGDKEYVNMPEVVAIGKRWRLDDEVKEELWRAEQAQEARNLRERQYNDRFKSGAAATTTSSSGRFKAEFLPTYDPRNARTVDMGIDNSRSEVVDLFKAKF